MHFALQALPKLHIHEVAPRDGFQTKSLFVSTRSKIRLIKLLAVAGPDSVEATAFVRSDKVPAPAEGLETRISGDA